MHWLSYKVQHQLLLNRRHVFLGFLLVADKSIKLSCFHGRTDISDLGRRNRGYFTIHFSKLPGLLGICSWASVQELVQIWLSDIFWRNQRVPSLAFWTSVGVRSISKPVFPTSTEMGRAGKNSGRFSAVSSLPLLPISLSACCRLAVPQGQCEGGAARRVASSAWAEQSRVLGQRDCRSSWLAEPTWLSWRFLLFQP